MKKPQIVFLDTSTLHNGELDFGELEKLGDLTCYKETSPNEVIGRCKGAHTVISNKVILNHELMKACVSLKQIISCATGVNQIDLDGAKECGITVQNVAGYSTDSVAQHVWSLILNLSTNTHQLYEESKAWSEFSIFTTLKYPIFEVQGKTLGIVGLGEIGKKVVMIARAFGMNVQALSRGGKEEISSCGVNKLPAGLFYSSSDIVSLHCPLTEDNEKMISSEVLGLMKKTAMLINTARGPLIDESALVKALEDGEIFAAGLDVLSTEPPEKENPLVCYQGKNLLITPHTAWSSIEARRVLLQGIVRNIETYFGGSPANQIC